MRIKHNIISDFRRFPVGRNNREDWRPFRQNLAAQCFVWRLVAGVAPRWSEEVVAPHRGRRSSPHQLATPRCRMPRSDSAVDGQPAASLTSAAALACIAGRRTQRRVDTAAAGPTRAGSDPAHQTLHRLLGQYIRQDQSRDRKLKSAAVGRRCTNTRARRSDRFRCCTVILRRLPVVGVVQRTGCPSDVGDNTCRPAC